MKEAEPAEMLRAIQNWELYWSKAGWRKEYQPLNQLRARFNLPPTTAEEIVALYQERHQPQK